MSALVARRSQRDPDRSLHSIARSIDRLLYFFFSLSLYLSLCVLHRNNTLKADLLLAMRAIHDLFSSSAGPESPSGWVSDVIPRKGAPFGSVSDAVHAL